MGFIGDIFGKGGGTTPPPAAVYQPQGDAGVAEAMMMMQEMMGGMMAGMQGQMQMMADQAASQQESILAQMNSTVSLPEVYRSPEIDFTEAQNQLNQKAKADFHRDQVRRKSITDTILTSPLLDEEQPDVGGSVLTGE